jgi:hypothetical protein
MEKAVNLRRLLRALLGIALFVIVGSVVRSLIAGHPEMIFTPHTPPTPTAIHDALVASLKDAVLPKKLDDSTTLTAVRVDGLRVVYSHGVITDVALLRTSLTKRACDTPDMRAGIKNGVSYRYEYWTDKTMVGSVDVTSCPA